MLAEVIWLSTIRALLYNCRVQMQLVTAVRNAKHTTHRRATTVGAVAKTNQHHTIYVVFIALLQHPAAEYTAS